MATAVATTPANGTAPVQAQRKSLIATMASRYDLEPQKFLNAVKATAFNGKGTEEEFIAFLVVADQYGLNPFTKEIFAFPKRGGGISNVVSVDGWCNIINSHPQMDGVEFFDELDEQRNLVAVTCHIFRKDRSHATTCTEYMAECRRGGDTPWATWPRRMLRHKALIQCARYAFGLSGIIDQDEAERGEVLTTATAATSHAKAKPSDANRLLTAPKESRQDYIEPDPVYTAEESQAEPESELAAMGETERLLIGLQEGFDQAPTVMAANAHFNGSATKHPELRAEIEAMRDRRIKELNK